MRSPLGIHILLDLWGVASALLDDREALENALVAASGRGGAQVVGSRFVRFAPQGVSGVVILSESHLAIHSWPERGFAAVDVFTCGSSTVAEAVVDAVVDALAPTVHDVRRVERGHAPPKAVATAGG